MNEKALIFASLYFLFISLLSCTLTVVDKRNAQKGKRRISEKTLMLCGFFGGALFELITMKKIRHKTLHKKFMVGLPLEIVFQLLAIAAALIFFNFDKIQSMIK